MYLLYSCYIRLYCVDPGACSWNKILDAALKIFQAQTCKKKKIWHGVSFFVLLMKIWEAPKAGQIVAKHSRHSIVPHLTAT